MSKKYYAIQQAEREADVYIFGDIVTDQWFPEETSGYSLAKELKELDADTINVHIDSYGGSVSEGWAIYNTLLNHPAKVVTYGDGFVASAALFPFLAGDERIASNLSAYYMHKVMVSASGYAEDMRAAAEEADTMTQIGIKAFADRAGMDAEEAEKLMEAESWLTAEQALEYGIATAIRADAAQKYAQSAKKSIIQKVTAMPTQKTQEPQEPMKKETQTNAVITALADFFNVKGEN